MGFVDDDQVPLDRIDAGGFVPRELVRAYDDVLGFEWTQISFLDRVVVGLRFEDSTRQKKLFLQLLMPLLPEIGRRDDQNPSSPFRPSLRDHETGFDGLAQANFISQNTALGQWGTEREERRLDLMWIQVDLGIDERPSELLIAVRSAAFRQLVSKILRVVWR